MAEGNEQIFQFKITLKYSKPPIWRRIQVPSNFTFDKLHLAIQIAMGWRDYHLHKFVINGETMTNYELDADDTLESGACLKDYFKIVKQKAIYEYDFGDGWEHIVVLERIEPKKPGVKYPKCIAGRKACPPEDCGGVGGYYDLLDAMMNPERSDYQERKEWLKQVGYRSFDPDKFSCDGIYNNWPSF